MTKLLSPSTKIKLKAVIIKLSSFSGFLNMAIDKMIFNNFEKIVNDLDNSIIVRFYTFANYTITLGYFQKKIDPEIKKQYKKWAFVKRITGGKAVFHYPKNDLTLCIVGSTNILRKVSTEYFNGDNYSKINKIHTFFNNIIWKSINESLNIQNLQNKNLSTLTIKNENNKNNQNFQEDLKLRQFDCFRNIQSFEKEFNGKKVIGTAIKISEFLNNSSLQKFILQANIKLQNLLPVVDKESIQKIINYFSNQFEYQNYTDLSKIFKRYV